VLFLFLTLDKAFMANWPKNNIPKKLHLPEEIPA